MLEIWAYA